MVRIVTFVNDKVWLFIQELHGHDEETKNLVPSSKFLCYFKFSEPSVMVYGELIRDPESKAPLVFGSSEAAESYATRYLRERFNF